MCNECFSAMFSVESLNDGNLAKVNDCELT